MRGVKFSTIIIIGILLSIKLLSASCYVNFDKTIYVAGQTATAEMSCSLNTEKNTAYTLNWTFQNGTSVELDSGTTPNVAGQFFYQSYTIPSTWPNGIFLNASLSGTGLTVTQNDSANVTAAGAGGTNTLEITNTTFGGGYLGLVSSVKATVTDENGKKISGGLCKVSALSNDETKILLETYTTPINGILEVSDILPTTRFSEGTDYAYEIHCYCGSIGGGTECVDEDGNSINNSLGTAKNFFTSKTYLQVNLVTDKNLYDLKDFITICANITNIDYPYRLPLEISYQARCSVGVDNNNDTDRSLIFSDGTSFDQRGISANTTQMQCKKFVIPEINTYEGVNSTCYASTNIWIIDNSGTRILDYPITSNVFYINNSELNLKVDWTQISNLTFNSIINLSSNEYKEWNGSNWGNIDIRLISPTETIDSTMMRVIQEVDLNNFMVSKYIKSINITNLTGDDITAYLEFTEDGNLEIELRDQNLNQSGWYNITLVFNDYEERQAIALEGIENKTGTFHLDVECPSEVTIGEDMNCVITAYVEDSQIVQKEVDFTCYITDGTNDYSSINFNQMVTKSAISISRNFLVPSSFEEKRQYILQCHADYYNLGSRRDSFYDTFTTSLTGSSGRGIESDKENGTGTPSITGQVTGGIEEIINKFNPFSPERNWFFIFMEIIILLGIIALAIISINKKKRKQYEKTKEIVSGVIKRVIGIIIIIGALFLLGKGAIYLYGLIDFENIPPSVSELENTSYILVQGNLVQGIFLIFVAILITSLLVLIFVTFLLWIISRLFGIEGEIKFGQNKENRWSRGDRKNSKLQERLNNLLLKDEIKKAEIKEDYKVRKMTMSEFRDFVKKKRMCKEEKE